MNKNEFIQKTIENCSKISMDKNIPMVAEELISQDITIEDIFFPVALEYMNTSIKRKEESESNYYEEGLDKYIGWQDFDYSLDSENDTLFGTESEDYGVGQDLYSVERKLKIAIQGDAGTGKSLLCRYITLTLLKGERRVFKEMFPELVLTNEFYFPILISLNHETLNRINQGLDLDDDSDYNQFIYELIKSNYQNLTIEDFRKIINEVGKENVLLIIDDWDIVSHTDFRPRGTLYKIDPAIDTEEFESIFDIINSKDKWVPINVPDDDYSSDAIWFLAKNGFSCLFTTRFITKEDAKEFNPLQIYRIPSLKEEEVFDYCAKFCDEPEEENSYSEGRVLAREILSSNKSFITDYRMHLLGLARLVLFYKNRRRLPKNEYEITKFYLENLISSAAHRCGIDDKTIWKFLALLLSETLGPYENRGAESFSKENAIRIINRELCRNTKDFQESASVITNNKDYNGDESAEAIWSGILETGVLEKYISPRSDVPKYKANNSVLKDFLVSYAIKMGLVPKLQFFLKRVGSNIYQFLAVYHGKNRERVILFLLLENSAVREEMVKELLNRNDYSLYLRAVNEGAESGCFHERARQRVYQDFLPNELVTEDTLYYLQSVSNKTRLVKDIYKYLLLALYGNYDTVNEEKILKKYENLEKLISLVVFWSKTGDAETYRFLLNKAFDIWSAKEECDISLLINLAELLFDEIEYKKALSVYQYVYQAIEYKEEERERIPRVLKCIADIYEKLEEYQQAKVWLEKIYLNRTFKIVIESYYLILKKLIFYADVLGENEEYFIYSVRLYIHDKEDATVRNERFEQLLISLDKLAKTPPPSLSEELKKYIVFLMKTLDIYELRRFYSVYRDYKRLLTIDCELLEKERKQFGDNSQQVLDRLLLLAKTYYHLRDYARSAATYKKALVLSRKGDLNPAVIGKDMGAFYMSIRKYRLAYYFLFSLTDVEHYSFGSIDKDDPLKLETSTIYATVCEKMPYKKKKYLKKAYLTREGIYFYKCEEFGAYSEEALSSLELIVQNLLLFKEKGKAEELAQIVYECRKRALGENDRKTISSQKILERIACES